MQKKIDLPTYWLNKFGDFDMECRGKVGVLNTTRPECLPDDQFVVEWKICFLPSTFVSTCHLSQAKCWEKSVVLVNSTLIQITFSKHQIHMFGILLSYA